MENRGYVIVTDHIEANTGKDVSGALQELILANPHKTIFFPDGEYILAKPICTPANPNNAVSLHLANFAILKAADGWNNEEAMVRMGGVDPFNSISIDGSNYYFIGGIIDGNGVAKGISIDSGRETLIKQVSIKHTTIGLHIKHGANNGSSDADIETVNIVGNGKAGSIGVLCDGYDNTFTNMRIAAVQTGIEFHGGGNFLKNIHPLYTFSPELTEVYKDSYAFKEMAGGNFYNNCYSDQFATGFLITSWSVSRYTDCYCMWYTAKGDKEVAYEAQGKFGSVIRGATVNYHAGSKPEFNSFIKVKEAGGQGIIDSPIIKEEVIGDKTYKDYLVGQVVPRP